MRGDRRVRRFVPELGQVVEQELPRENLLRVAIKMATGSGKDGRHGPCHRVVLLPPPIRA